MDDIANPGLLARSKTQTATFADIFRTEFNAFFVQYSNKIAASAGGLGTALANTLNYAGVALPMREALYGFGYTIGLWE